MAGPADRARSPPRAALPPRVALVLDPAGGGIAAHMLASRRTSCGLVQGIGCPSSSSAATQQTHSSAPRSAASLAAHRTATRLGPLPSSPAVITPGMPASLRSLGTRSASPAAPTSRTPSVDSNSSAGPAVAQGRRSPARAGGLSVAVGGRITWRRLPPLPTARGG